MIIVATLHWESVRMRLTFLKWGLGSLSGLSKFQSSISWVKTPRIGAFFVSLESYQSVDVKNGLAWAIWTSAAQVMAKRKVRRLPTTKSQELTRPRCVQEECNTSLERSRRKLQLCFRSCPNQRFEQRIIVPQSYGSPNRGSFETPPWESRDKKPFRCGCREEAQRIL